MFLGLVNYRFEMGLITHELRTYNHQGCEPRAEHCSKPFIEGQTLINSNYRGLYTQHQFMK